MIFNKQKNEAGLGLIEVIASLGLAIVVITSLVSLSVFTLKTSNIGKLQVRANKVSKEQVELLRALRDDNSWTDFINLVSSCSSVSPCHVDISGNSLSVLSGEGKDPPGTDPTPNDVNYFFSVTDPINGDGVAVSDTLVRLQVVVEWEISGETKTSSIYTDISNWRGAE